MSQNVSNTPSTSLEWVLLQKDIIALYHCTHFAVYVYKKNIRNIIYHYFSVNDLGSKAMKNIMCFTVEIRVRI